MFIHRADGITTIKPRGGFFRCEECSTILGYIDANSYEYLNFHTVCGECGNYGRLEFSRNRDEFKKTVGRAPDFINRVYVCSDCQKPMFSVDDDRCSNFSFYIKCKCGAEYDRRVKFKERLGETIRRINDKKE